MSPRPRIPRLAALLFALVVAAVPAAARADAPPVLLETVQSPVDFPTTLRFAPDGRMFATELTTGIVRVWASADAPVSSVWAQLPAYDQGERGMLGMALHPAFPDSPFVYVYHTLDAGGGPYNRVVRLTDSSGVGVAPAVILDALPGNAFIHSGGRLAFGPDGMLYTTFGDQMVPDFADDPERINGKILRTTSTGRPAPGNPWGPYNPAIAMGTRNAYGLAFDALTGEGYFTENGLGCDDELNLLSFAADYGWDGAYACHVVPPGTRAPLWSFTPTLGLTGCTVYRDTLFDTLDGDVLFGCFNDGKIRRAVIRDGRPDVVDTLEVLALVPDDVVLDVTVGPGGAIYVAATGSIRRIVPPVDLGVDRGGPGARLALGPNPFRGRLTLTLPADGSLGRVEIADVTGRRVRAWDDVRGTLAWDGRGDDGRALPHGMYFVRASGAAGAVTRRVVRLDP